jgi:hypothetical protein
LKIFGTRRSASSVSGFLCVVEGKPNGGILTLKEAKAEYPKLQWLLRVADT